MQIVVKEPFNPKVHPAVAQADVAIRAFGIEFQSRYGVLAELRLLISVVETWMPRGLFWHVAKIFYDSKGGSILVSLKERDGNLCAEADQIARLLKLHIAAGCTTVFVEDHRQQIIAEASNDHVIGRGH